LVKRCKGIRVLGCRQYFSDKEFNREGKQGSRGAGEIRRLKKLLPIPSAPMLLCCLNEKNS
jgi:hypothetical protein